MLRGDDYAGRHQAANLVTSFFEDLGIDSVTGLDTSQGSPLKASLLQVRRQLEEQPVEVLPGWLASARMSAVRVSEELGEKLRQGDQLRGVILEDVDAAGPLSPTEVIALSDLAANAPCALVVTSRQEVDTRWALTGRLLPGMKILDLRYFNRDDVHRVLSHSPELAGRPVEDLERVLRLLLATSGSTEIMPMLAYTALRALQ